MPTQTPLRDVPSVSGWCRCHGQPVLSDRLSEMSEMSVGHAVISRSDASSRHQSHHASIAAAPRLLYKMIQGCCINPWYTPALYLHTHFTSCFASQYNTQTLSPSRFAFFLFIFFFFIISPPSPSLFAEPWMFPVRQIRLFSSRVTRKNYVNTCVLCYGVCFVYHSW